MKREKFIFQRDYQPRETLITVADPMVAGAIWSWRIENGRRVDVKWFPPIRWPA